MTSKLPNSRIRAAAGALIVQLTACAACERPQDGRRGMDARIPAGAPAAAGGDRPEQSPALPHGRLERGAEHEVQIAAGETHRYEIFLEDGEYLHLEVEQHGVDLALSADELGKFDSPNGAYGSEHLWALAPAAGTYLVDLKASTGPGSYVLRHVAQGPPTGEDQLALNAWRTYSEGQRRRRQSPREALQPYREALALWQRLEDPIRQATAMLRIGQAQLAAGEKGQAIRSLQEALGLLAGQGQTSQEVVTLRWLGSALRRNAEYSRALAAFEEALRRIRRVGDRFEEAQALNNVAVALDLQGRMSPALRSYQAALDIYRDLQAPPKIRALTRTNMAFSHILAGQLTEARQNLLAALELYRQEEDPRGVARIWIHLGWIAYREGDLGQALEFYDRTLEELSRTSGKDSAARRIRASALDRKGKALQRRGELKRARQAFVQARQIFSELAERYFVALTEVNLARLDLDEGEVERAWSRFQEARGHFERSGDRHGQVNVLDLGARIQRRRGRLPEARGLLEKALEIVENNRRTSANPEVRMSYLGSRYDYYSFYIDLLMELHEKEPAAGHAAAALSAVERSRARNLLDHLTAAGADFKAGIDAELLAEEKALQDRINALELELLALRSPGNESQLRDTVEGYRRLRDKIRAASPGYAALTQARPATLQQVQDDLLDDESLLLVYSLGPERSFLWAVSSSSMTAHPLAPAAEIETTALRLHRRLSKSAAPGAAFQAELIASDLSEKVLAPVASELGSRRLLVMPDGALHLVPFAVLPRPGGGAPLVVEHEVASVPSASTLMALRRETAQRPAADGYMAVLADPVFQPDDSRVRSSGPPVTGSPTTPLDGFERLTESRAEAEWILAQLPEGASHREAFDFAARRELVMSGSLADYRYLHFATHATFDFEHPERSAIVLSLVDERGRPIDGRIRAHELYQLRLSAELVVLSACDTARGRLLRGEGVMGLSRGLLYAGAPRVVVSLWRISDRGTAELMKRFYDAHLRRGMRPAAALRDAQKSMLAEPRWQAPYYWAAFVFQGDWR